MVTTRSGRTTDGVSTQKRRRTAVKKVNVKNKRTGRSTKVLTAAGVKSVILGLSETKRFPATDQFATVAVNSFIGYNLLYWIANGSSDAQRIGDDIFIEKFRLRCQVRTIRPTFTATVNAGDDVQVAFYLIKEITQNHDGIIGPASTGFAYPDFRVGAVGSQVNPAIDFNKVSIVWQKKFVLKPDNAGAVAGVYSPNNQLFVLNEDVYIRKKFQYSTATSGYGKDFNYYLVFAQCSPGGAGALLVQHSLGYEVDFKDM